MKIAYDNNGNIEAVAVDSQNISGTNIASVTDNLDLISNPSKYKYIDGNIVKRKYIQFTTQQVDSNSNGIPDQVANGLSEITINVKSYNSDDTLDTSASDVITLMDEKYSTESSSVTLVNGEANFNIKSNWVGQKTVTGNVADKWIEDLIVEFI